MASNQWLGAATPVTQINSITIGTFDVTTTYLVTINGVSISVVGVTNANTTATNLRAALVASTHPFFKYITWTVATNIITATSQNSGIPFTVSTSVAGGTGTISGAVVTTATGPNHFSNVLNWSLGAVPVNGDDIIFADNTVSVLFDLDQSAVTPTSIRIYQSYTGKIGLNVNAFTYSASGTDTNASEYRGIYWITNCAKVYIGESISPNLPAGSTRIMINLGTATAATVEVFNTASNSSETGKPCIRLLGTNANHKLYVRSAPGGIGVAVDKPSETATFNTITISDTSTNSKVSTGKGTTLTTWTQEGGDNILQAAATVTTCIINGGTLQTEGDFTITTVTFNDGTFNQNHIKTAGNCITTLTLNKGTCETLENSIARTYGTVFLGKGAFLSFNPNVVSWTTLNWTANRGSKVTVE